MFLVEERLPPTNRSGTYHIDAWVRRLVGASEGVRTPAPPPPPPPPPPSPPPPASRQWVVEARKDVRSRRRGLSGSLGCRVGGRAVSFLP